MNKPLDMISIEEFQKAEKTLEDIRSFDRKFLDLSNAEIAVLRFQAQWQHGLLKEIVDEKDRLALVRCLFYYCEQNKKGWEQCRLLKLKLGGESKGGWRASILKYMRVILYGPWRLF